MSFNKSGDGVKAFIFEDEKSVVFLKLYLITKEQMIDILRFTYGITVDKDVMLKSLKDLNSIGKKFVNIFRH
jgi:hypothetical protein